MCTFAFDPCSGSTFDECRCFDGWKYGNERNENNCEDHSHAEHVMGSFGGEN